jgi:hypothetical protein
MHETSSSLPDLDDLCTSCTTEITCRDLDVCSKTTGQDLLDQIRKSQHASEEDAEGYDWFTTQKWKLKSGHRCVLRTIRKMCKENKL